MVKMPHMDHTTNDKLTEPVDTSTPVGETKIPEPIMQPTITVMPFNKVISAYKKAIDIKKGTLLAVNNLRTFFTFPTL